jgi:hypothetical protein
MHRCRARGGGSRFKPHIYIGNGQCSQASQGSELWIRVRRAHPVPERILRHDLPVRKATSASRGAASKEEHLCAQSRDRYKTFHARHGATFVEKRRSDGFQRPVRRPQGLQGPRLHNNRLVPVVPRARRRSRRPRDCPRPGATGSHRTVGTSAPFRMLASRPWSRANEQEVRAFQQALVGVRLCLPKFVGWEGLRESLNCQPSICERLNNGAQRSAVVTHGPNPLPVVLNGFNVQVPRRIESNCLGSRMMGGEQQPTVWFENAPKLGERRTPVPQVVKDQRTDDSVESGLGSERERAFEICDPEFHVVSKLVQPCRRESLPRMADHRDARIDRRNHRSSGGEFRSVPSCSAAGIEYARSRYRRQQLQHRGPFI